MAFMKYATATVVSPHVSRQKWQMVRTAGRGNGKVPQKEAPNKNGVDLAENLVDRATDIFGEKFDPTKYLLTHATIVCSVDTYAPADTKKGRVLEDGFRVNRKYANFRVKPNCDKYINNNLDAWSREVLLKSFETFIGGHNFCFASGTGVLLADGTYRAIEAIEVGDLVVTHTGAVRPVTHKFERDYDDDIQAIRVGRFDKPVFATGNHPFRTIGVKAPPLTCREGSSLKSRARYRQDQVTSALRDGTSHFGRAYPATRAVRDVLQAQGPLMAGDLAEVLGYERGYASVLLQILKRHGDQFESRPLRDDEYPDLKKGRSRVRVWSVRADAPALPDTEVRAQAEWCEAGRLVIGTYLLGAERKTGEVSDPGRAALLGYYLAEGCRLSPHRESGVVFSFGAHERNLAEHTARLVEEHFPGTNVQIQKPQAGTLRVHCYGADIDQWMVRHGGVYSESKRLHPDVFAWDRESLLRMLSSWVAGDGDFNRGTLRLRGSTTSKALAEQMQRVAEVCGVKSSVVFERAKIGEVQSQVTMVAGGQPRVFDVVPGHHKWTVLVSKDSTSELACRTIRWGAALHDVNAVRKRQEFAWWGNCRVHRVASNMTIPYAGKVYNLEVEGDNSYVVDPGLAVHNCEHVQVEDLSKGRIIDAVARDIGESVYVDILIATDRKHTELVKDIDSGKMSTLSMGCFLPGTQVTMADGRRIAIEDVQPGDMVLTHKGRAREVLNKQIRGGKWGIRRIQAVGVPDTIEATDNHPFFVFRQPNTCACGCGELLPEYKNGRKNATRGLKRRFKTGHDKRILNPNNTYSIMEYKERKARLDAIQAGEGQWVRADDLRVGDFLCFPRVQAEDTAIISTGKARLLGYYLAEGSFQKYKGGLSAVVFSFSMEEKETFVAEVVNLLKQEFPGKEPNVYDHDHRNVCSVRLGDREAAQWFFQHGGEYSNHKVLSAEVMVWPVEAHKHLVGAWINGDGHLHGIHEHTSVTTTSYDLACQMHLLMARCGWFARMEAKIGAKCVDVREIVNGGFVRDETTGKLPHFNLIIGKTQAVGMTPYTVKAAATTAFDSQGPRVRDDVVMFPITSIEETAYDGWVHNMEVAEDNSYVVSGICSHNCTVDGTICTKCGHWAADETEMCFPTGTRVLMADGKYVPIEEVVEGDLVITHMGAVQPVLHKMGRHHEGNVTVLNVEGVPQPVRATTGHRFWVMRPETHCQCGCWEPLRRTIEHERGAVQAFQRRFLPGHNSKVLVSNGGLILPFTTAPRETGAKLEFIPAKDIRKGDYLTFPIPQQVTQSPDATEAKARLIGFFLAEGSFVKRDGALVGVSFDFGAHEHDTLAAEVEGLLNEVWGHDERRTVGFDWQSKVAADGIKTIRRRKTSRPVPSDITCPSCEAPSEYAYNVRFKKGRDDCYQCKVCDRQWVEGADRAVKARRSLTGESACTVRLMWADAAEWFHRFCGEYAYGKVLASEVMYWPQEVQKHVLFGWLGGDGTQSRLGITGNTASFDLVSQMHVLAARCGWYSRKRVTFDRRAAILDEVVNGSGPVTVRDSNGWLPSFSLTVAEPAGFGGEVRFSDPENARVTLAGITDGFKRVGNYLLYRVREAWNECFSGQVHNIEVAGDESYVVEGLAVHNCPHVKYEKGNSFYDEKGRLHRVAELCGHESLDPTGGVHFIEASWVETPAFTGAVLRNVIEPTDEIAEKAAKVLSMPPKQWQKGIYQKAARGTRTATDVHTLSLRAKWGGNLVDEADPQGEPVVVAKVRPSSPLTYPDVLGVGRRTAEADTFLAGWDEFDSGEGGGDEGGEEAAPAAPATPSSPFQDVEDEITQHLLDRVKKRLKKDISKDDESSSAESMAPNDTLQREAALRARAETYRAGIDVLVRTASSDVALLDSVAQFNQAIGIQIPTTLYRAALKVGSVDGYKSDVEFVKACRSALGRQPNEAELRMFIRLGHLLARRGQAHRGFNTTPGSRH